MAEKEEEKRTFETRIPLREGKSIPIYGLGTWTAKENDCYCSVLHALKTGHRLIDTAQMYDNEEEVGKAIKDSGIEREKIFLVTKLRGQNHEQKVRSSLLESLEKLQTKYVDLFLIHSPNGKNVVQVWKEMVQLKKDGLVCSLGVSNFGAPQIQGMIDSGLEAPEVNQIELHAYWPQTKEREFNNKHKIVTMGFCPLARCKRFGEEEKAVSKLAKKLNVSEAKILISWSLSSGVVTIPKSSNLSRIDENASSLSLSLSDLEMKELEGVADGFHASSACQAMEIPWDDVK